ncbi:MAG: hypothetical protein IT361_04815 [Gemmatimonadaceae bacterium]|nr:hypothetical protein [Gemmatimonadaceae bacterium]
MRRPVGGALGALLETPLRVAATLTETAVSRAGSCGCEVPPPCWEPRHAGTCRLEVPPGGTATVRVHVANCGWGRQVVAVTALGKLAAWLTFTPTALVLDPQESATFLVTVHVPDKVPIGQRLSAPLIVRGCNNHFVRLEVLVTDCAGRTCCDVAIDDCPDHVHHWYDHFYCPRPCLNPRLPGTVGRDG